MIYQSTNFGMLNISVNGGNNSISNEVRLIQCARRSPTFRSIEDTDRRINGQDRAVLLEYVHVQLQLMSLVHYINQHRSINDHIRMS